MGKYANPLPNFWKTYWVFTRWVMTVVWPIGMVILGVVYWLKPEVVVLDKKFPYIIHDDTAYLACASEKKYDIDRLLSHYEFRYDTTFFRTNTTSTIWRGHLYQFSTFEEVEILDYLYDSTIAKIRFDRHFGRRTIETEAFIPKFCLHERPPDVPSNTQWH